MRKKIRTLSIISALLLILLPSTQARGQSETTISLSTSQYRLARLSATASSDEAAFPVDQCGAISVEIIATVGNVSTSVETPSGQIINPSNVATFGGSFQTAQGDDTADGPSVLPSLTRGFHYSYSLPFQGAGNYRIHFQAPSGLAEEVPVFTELTTDSPVRAKLFATEGTILQGRPAVLAAAVVNGQSPLAGANVTVLVTPPSGPDITLTLRDDGGASDGAAGDGLYSGEFTPAAPGLYRALAIVTGSTSGGPFKRETAAEINVINPPSRLNGAVSDHGVDDDSDGLLDRVTFDVSTQTTSAGHYRAFVHLKTAGGKSIVGSSDADLAAGAGTLPVNIFAEDFRSSGENGPYTVEFIELDSIGASGASPCDRLDDLGQTQAYQLSQFQRKPLILTGVTTDQGVDDNGNGRFDRLLVTVQVDARFAGFYSWNMKLADQSGRQLEFSSSTGFLNSGLNNLTFSFDGAAIGSSGADGPFRLSDLLLFGPKSIVVPEAGLTQAYRSIQFENGHGSDVTPPSLSVTLTPDTLWPANHRLVPVTANVQVSDDTDPHPTVTLVSVTSNEPDDGLGDGDTPNDIQDAATGTDDREFQLRAERSGKGGGRVYTVTYRATDAAGNTTTVSVQVSVPHDKK